MSQPNGKQPEQDARIEIFKQAKWDLFDGWYMLPSGYDFYDGEPSKTYEWWICIKEGKPVGMYCGKEVKANGLYGTNPTSKTGHSQFISQFEARIKKPKALTNLITDLKGLEIASFKDTTNTVDVVDAIKTIKINVKDGWYPLLSNYDGETKYFKRYLFIKDGAPIAMWCGEKIERPEDDPSYRFPTIKDKPGLTHTEQLVGKITDPVFAPILLNDLLQLRRKADGEARAKAFDEQFKLKRTTLQTRFNELRIDLPDGWVKLPDGLEYASSDEHYIFIKNGKPIALWLAKSIYDEKFNSPQDFVDYLNEPGDDHIRQFEQLVQYEDYLEQLECFLKCFAQLKSAHKSSNAGLVVGAGILTVLGLGVIRAAAHKRAQQKQVVKEEQAS